MKVKSFFNGPCMAIILLFSIILPSCEKNDIDSVGSANAKFVNAASTSTAQSVYLAGNQIISGGLTFGNGSAYLSTVSGNRLVTEFKNDGTTTNYATGKNYMESGKNYSVYLAGEGSLARVKQYEDDLSPSSGMAKIKFIHLSDKAPSLIYIKDAAGNELVTNLTINLASKYINITPGNFSFQIYGTALKDKVGDFNLSGLAAGKVYTVCIAESNSGVVSVLQIANN